MERLRFPPGIDPKFKKGREMARPVATAASRTSIDIHCPLQTWTAGQFWSTI